MKKEGDLRKLLNPIVKLEPYVKAIWEDEGEITLLLDDTIEDELQIKKLNRVLEKYKGANFNKKNLTLWWEMVRNAEPKTLEQLKSMTLVFDKSDIVKLFRGMIHKGMLFTSNKKADIFFERAKKHLDKSENILLNNVSEEIFLAMTEAAQALLLYLGKFSPNQELVLKDLETFSKKTSHVPASLFLAYKEISDEYNNIIKGKKKEFSAKDAGYFISQAKNFMFAMEDMMTNFEKERSNKLMHETYNFCLRLCEMALKQQMRVLPLRDDEKIEAFKKYYIDSGKIDKIHYETLEALYLFNSSSRKGKVGLMDDKALDRNRIKNLGLAVQDVLIS